MKWIKDNLSILSLALLSVSLMRLMIYYNEFNIKILDYIDLSEAVTLSLTSLTYPFILFSIATLFFYFARNSEVFTKFNPQRQQLVLESGNFIKRFSAYHKEYVGKLPLFIIGIIIILFFISPFVELFNKSSFGFALFYSLYLFYGGFFWIELSYQYKISKGQYLSHNTKNLGNALSYLIVMNIALADLEATAIKNSLQYQKVTVGFGTKIIKSNSHYKYVGKSKGYIFFYDTKARMYNVYNISKVDSLSIQ